MPAITNCQVSRNNAVVINNPTSAELYNDMQPQMYITVTGGNPNPALVKNAVYKITGTVATIARTFPKMKCVNTGDPARFDWTQ
jgi:hypothetical protein